MSNKVQNIANKIVRALDRKGAHDVNPQDVVRLLVPGPRHTDEEKATNSLLRRKLSLDLIMPTLSLEGNLLALGVTDEELDELLG